MKQKLTELKQETDKSTVITGDFNIPLSVINGTGRQKTSKYIIYKTEQYYKQLVLIDIYRTLQPKTAVHTFFSSVHGTFTNINHILCHKIIF